MNNLDTEDIQFLQSNKAKVIADDDYKTLVNIKVKDYEVSLIKWKDNAYPRGGYEMAVLDKTGNLVPIYGVGDDVVALENLNEVKTLINNIREGKSIGDKSWLEGIDRLYEKADETEKKNRSEYEETSSDNTRKKNEDRKRNALKIRQLRRKLHKRRSDEKVPNVVLKRRDSEKIISDTEKRTIISEVKMEIYRGKARK